MIFRMVTVPFLLFFLMIHSAAADERYNYAGADLMAINYDTTGASAQPLVLVGRFGHFQLKNFGVEARIGTSAAQDELSSDSTTDVKVDRFAGLFGIARIPLGSRFDLYGLIGTTQVRLKATGTTTTTFEDYNGTTVGVGFTVHFGAHWEMRGEYTSLYDDGDDTLTGAAINLGYAF